MIRIDMELPIIFDDAEIEAAEIMGLMLREGQSLKVQRKIAKRIREFKMKDRKP